MNAADMRELAHLLAQQSKAQARADCHTCIHSIGADYTTGQRLRERGYTLGMGAFRHGVGLICDKHHIVGPTQCKDYERIPGPGQPEC